MAEEDNKKAIGAFLMDIDVLDSINSRLAHFNVFETLGIINAEIRHSNVLAWLLNPNENHGLGDFFIKKLIQSIFYNSGNALKNTSFDLFKISLMDYNDFFVRREWRNIDLLAVSETNKLILIIENKIWSKESSNQLKKYYQIANEEFPNYEKVFIYLTPHGDSPSDEDNWMIMDYNCILENLQKAIDLKHETIGASVKTFLEQYMVILRRYIVGDSELENICREIYYKHQKALDLIFEYKPDIYSEIASYLGSLIGANPDLINDISTKNYVRFTTKKFDNLIEKKGKEWTTTQRILLFEIQIKNEKVVLKLIIGPGDEGIRQKLYDVAINNSDVFKGLFGALTPKWTQIYSKELLPKNYIEKHDSSLDLIQEEIEKKLLKFVRDDLPVLENSILNCYIP